MHQLALAVIGGIFRVTRRRRPTGSRGASLVEYAFLVALIAIVCLTAVTFFGGEVGVPIDEAASSLQAG